MKKIFILLLLIIFSLPVFAFDWILIEPLGFYIKKSSITRDKEFVKAKIVYAEKDGYDIHSNKKYVSERYIEADCRRKQFWYLRGKKYRRTRFTTTDTFPINPQKLHKVTLNTNEQRETFLNFLCSIK